MKTNLRCWILFTLFTVLAALPLVAATGVPELVKDISTATDDSSPTDFVYASGWFYFAADDGTNGRELWKTDGTTGNTGMVEDINPGSTSSNPHLFANLGGTVLFWATSPTYGVELWKTDGTTTTRLTDTPAPSVGVTNPLAVGVAGSFLYFSLNNGGTVELWKSGGTSGTTAKIEDIGTGSSATAFNFVDANGTLFFVGSDGTDGYDRELWKSDGTPGGTGLVTNFNPSGSGVNVLFAFGDNVLFQGDDGDGYGYELCISDGTPGGTQRIMDINSGWRDSSPRYFAIINGKVCFTARQGTSDEAPWVTDGTADGTKRLADFRAPTSFIEFGGAMYFRASYISGDSWVYGIYTTDGTPENTALFKGDVGFSNPVVSGSTLFFTAWTDENGEELWSSNGTAPGTNMIKDLLPGPVSSSPREFCAGGGLLAFAALDATRGKEPWISDGTAGNTDVVRDINTNGLGSDAYGAQSVEINGVAYFPLQTDDSPSGQIDAYGEELWRSDGTDDGTYMVMDINPGSNSSDPEDLVRAGDTLFFSADDGTHGRELWKHDGPTKATARVTDLDPNGDSVLDIAGAVNGRVIFWANDGSGGDIWWSDGTTTDVLVSDAGVGYEPGVMLDGKLIFFGTMNKLYATDGSPGGTEELGDIGGQLLTVVGNKVFFTAIHDSFSLVAYQLWVTNGTAAGTDYVTAWRDWTNGIDTAAGITAVGNKAFFVADESSTGTDKQLWACDATTLNTEKITTDLAGTAGRIVGGVEYKRKYIGTTGSALVESDGTPGNATVINDTVTFQGDLTPLGGLLYFKSYDGAGGSELWRTDATENGAERVADLMPGAAGSDPQLVGKLVEVLPTKELSDTETLLFFADSPGIGSELWKVTEPVYDDTDTTGPVITINGSAHMVLELNLDTYTELGATAIDDVDGPVTVFTTGSEDVDTTTLGTYWVMYTAYDAAGNGGWASRRVDVVEPTGLCDILVNSVTLLSWFRIDFEAAILAACDGVIDDLACYDPVHDRVYDDSAAIALAYRGACPGTNPTIAASTHEAFEQNQLELAAFAAANPGVPELRAHVDILAALGLLSAARRDGITAVFDEAGLDFSGYTLTVVSCSSPGTKIDCYPPPTKGASKQYSEVYSEGGDFDGDGVTNVVELKNVIDAGGTTEDFAESAADPENDGTDVGPGALCVLSEDFDLLLDAFVQDYGVATDDLDGDGVPEAFVLQLVRNTSCFQDTSSLRQATLNAYDINLAFLEVEAEAAAVADHKDILAVLLFLSQDTKAAVLGILDGNGITLTSDYVVVTCDAGDCLPAVSKDIMMVFDETSKGAKALNEPYSASGDLDGDGLTDLQEYQNVMANGGTAEFFAMVAAEALCDGTETQAERCDLSGNDGANAIDVQLVINAALSLPVDVIFIDVDFTDTVNAVDVQLVINAALGLLTR